MSKLVAADSVVNGEEQAVLRHISSELPEMTHLGREESYATTHFSPLTTKRF